MPPGGKLVHSIFFKGTSLLFFKIRSNTIFYLKVKLPNFSDKKIGKIDSAVLVY